MNLHISYNICIGSEVTQGNMVCEVSYFPKTVEDIRKIEEGILTINKMIERNANTVVINNMINLG